MAPRNISTLERLVQTKLGIRVRQHLIVDGKVVARRWRSIAVAALERTAVNAPDVLLITAEIVAAAAKLRNKLMARFAWLEGFSPQSFAEIYATVLNRGRQVDVVVRGLVVERLIPGMAQMDLLLRDLGKLTKATGKDWGLPVLVSGLRTPNGRQIADWVILSTHKDGRVWVMALVESKSISNMEHLITQEGRGTGQFLWDYLRATGEGLVLDVIDGAGNVTSTTIERSRVVLQPVASGAVTKPAFPTRFIGVIPEKFTKRQLMNAQSAGIAIEQWVWPLPQSEVLKLIDAIEKTLTR